MKKGANKTVTISLRVSLDVKELLDNIIRELRISNANFVKDLLLYFPADKYLADRKAELGKTFTYLKEKLAKDDAVKGSENDN